MRLMWLWRVPWACSFLLCILQVQVSTSVDQCRRRGNLRYPTATSLPDKSCNENWPDAFRDSGSNQPAFFGVTPQTGSQMGGQALLIQGQALDLQQQTQVQLADGSMCEVQSASNDSITCIVPTQRHLNASDRIPAAHGVVFSQWKGKPGGLQPEQALSLPNRQPDLVLTQRTVTLPPFASAGPFMSKHIAILSGNLLSGMVGIWTSSSGWVDIVISDDAANKTLVDFKHRVACLDFFCDDSQRATSLIVEPGSTYTMTVTFLHVAGNAHLLVALTRPESHRWIHSFQERQVLMLKPQMKTFTQRLQVQNVSGGSFQLQQGFQSRSGEILTKTSMPVFWNQNLADIQDSLPEIRWMKAEQGFLSAIFENSTTWIAIFNDTAFDGQLGLRESSSNLSCTTNSNCGVTITTLQEGTHPVSGVFTVKANGRESEYLRWGASAADVRDSLQAIIGDEITCLEVERIGTEHAGFNYTVQYSRSEELAVNFQLNTSLLSGGAGNESVYKSVVMQVQQSNSTLLWPIPPKVPLLPPLQHEVRVVVDGHLIACLGEQGDCSFSSDALMTPWLSGAQVIMMPTEERSGQLVLVGTGFTPQEDVAGRETIVQINGKECEITSLSDSVIVCEFELDDTAGKHEVTLLVAGKGYGASQNDTLFSVFDKELLIVSLSEHTVSALGGGHVLLEGLGFGDQIHKIHAESTELQQQAEVLNVQPGRLVLEAPRSDTLGPVNFTLTVNGVQESFELVYSDEAPAIVFSLAENDSLLPGNDSWPFEYDAQFTGLNQTLVLSATASSEILITGVDFDWQQMSVSVGKEVCEIISGTDTKLICRLPAESPLGLFDVTVNIYPYGALPNPFAIQRAFQIDSISPRLGSDSGGLIMTIQGKGFPDGLGVLLTGSSQYRCSVIWSNATTVQCYLELQALGFEGSSGFSRTLQVGLSHHSKSAECVDPDGCVLSLSGEYGGKIVTVSPPQTNPAGVLTIVTYLPMKPPDDKDVYFVWRPITPTSSFISTFNFADEFKMLDFLSLQGCGRLYRTEDVFTCQLPEGFTAGAYQLLAWWPSLGISYSDLLFTVSPELHSIRPTRWRSHSLIRLSGRGFGEESENVVVVIDGEFCPLYSISPYALTCKVSLAGNTTISNTQVIVNGVPAVLSTTDSSLADDDIFQGTDQAEGTWTEQDLGELKAILTAAALSPVEESSNEEEVTAVSESQKARRSQSLSKQLCPLELRPPDQELVASTQKASTIAEAEPNGGARAPGPLPPVVKEQFKRRWSDATQWPNLMLPAEGDDVVIPPEWDLVLDTNASVRNVIVHGRLSFLDARQNLVLRASSIHVPVTGTLEVGSAERPYASNAKIVLDESSSGSLQGLLVEGTLVMVGESTRPSVVHLAAEADPGDLSIELTSSVGWKEASAIFIAASFYDSRHGEYANIQAVNGSTLVLEQPVKFLHHGTPSPSLVSGKQIELRSEVVSLSRNIQISDESSEGGGSISYVPGSQESRLFMTGVEIFSLGGYHQPILSITGKNATLTNLAIYGSRGPGIVIADSSGVTCTDNKVVQSVGPALTVINATSCRISGNFATSVMPEREWMSSRAAESAVTYSICASRPSAPQICTDLEFKNNIAAGSPEIAFYLQGNPCGDLPNEVEGNLAHSSAVGVQFSEQHNQSCLLSTGLTAHHCHRAGVLLPRDLDEIQLKDTLLADNHRGVSFGPKSAELLNARARAKTDGRPGVVEMTNCAVIGISEADQGICAQMPYSRILASAYGPRYCQRIGIDLSGTHSASDWGSQIEQFFGASLVMRITDSTFSGWTNSNSSMIALDNSGAVQYLQVSNITKTQSVNDSLLVRFRDLHSQNKQGAVFSTLADTDGGLTGNKSQVLSLMSDPPRNSNCSIRTDWNAYSCEGDSLVLLTAILDSTTNMSDVPELLRKQPGVPGPSRQDRIAMAAMDTISPIAGSIFQTILSLNEEYYMTLDTRTRTARLILAGQHLAQKGGNLAIRVGNEGAYRIRTCVFTPLPTSSPSRSETCKFQTVLGPQDWKIPADQSTATEADSYQQLTVDIEETLSLQWLMELALTNKELQSKGGLQGLAEEIRSRLMLLDELSVHIFEDSTEPSQVGRRLREKKRTQQLRVVIASSGRAVSSKEAQVYLESTQRLVISLARHSAETFPSAEWGTQSMLVTRNITVDSSSKGCLPSCQTYLGRGVRCHNGACVCNSPLQIYQQNIFSNASQWQAGCVFDISESSIASPATMNIDLSDSLANVDIPTKGNSVIPVMNTLDAPDVPTQLLFGREPSLDLIPSEQTGLHSIQLPQAGLEEDTTAKAPRLSPMGSTSNTQAQALLLANNISSAVLSPVVILQESVQLSVKFSRLTKAVNVSWVPTCSFEILTFPSLPNTILSIEGKQNASSVLPRWEFELQKSQNSSWGSACGGPLRLQISLAKECNFQDIGFTNSQSNSLDIVWWPPSLLICSQASRLTPEDNSTPAANYSLEFPLLLPRSQIWEDTGSKGLYGAYRRQIASVAGVLPDDVNFQKIPGTGVLVQTQIGYGVGSAEKLQMEIFNDQLMNNYSLPFSSPGLSTYFDRANGEETLGATPPVIDFQSGPSSTPPAKETPAVAPAAEGPSVAPQTLSAESQSAGNIRQRVNIKAIIIIVSVFLGLAIVVAILAGAVWYLSQRGLSMQD